MNIIFSLSAKTNNVGKSQIMLYANPSINGHRYSWRAKSGVFILPQFFDAGKPRGIKASSKRIADQPYLKEAREAEKQMANLLDHVMEAYTKGNVNFSKNWLQSVIDAYYTPSEDEGEKTVLTLADVVEECMKSKQGAGKISPGVVRRYGVVRRMVQRYQIFKKAEEGEEFILSHETATRADMEDFRDYVRNEAALCLEHPDIFAAMPGDFTSAKIQERGENRIISIMKLLRSVFTWCKTLDTAEPCHTDNDPFKGLLIGREEYADPYFITIGERKSVAAAAMPSVHLARQRDIFVFQCLVACRVGDLMKLTRRNIVGNTLVYTPQKTGETTGELRVPLAEEARALVERYKGLDCKGRLFPFTCQQQYNEDIKKVLTVAGVCRMVEVRDSVSGEYVMRPINEIATSHMARRTFCGNMYNKVKDPNIIGKMSGHAEGSRAFSRYRNISEETLAEAVKALE